MASLHGEMLKLAAARMIYEDLKKQGALDYGAASNIKFWPLLKDEFARGVAKMTILLAPALLALPFLGGAAAGIVGGGLGGTVAGASAGATSANTRADTDKSPRDRRGK